MTNKSSTKVVTAGARLSRDEYGALQITAHLQPEQIEAVRSLLARASTMEKGIEATFQHFGKNEYECMNHDVYDVLLERGKVRAVVVQARWFWKHLRKTRTAMKKTYYLLTVVRKQVTVRQLDNATCAKRAKNTTRLGQLAGHYLGTATVRCAGPLSGLVAAYKVLAKTDAGQLVSAFDGSEYHLGAWRCEQARPNHGGGYYCYLNKDVAVQATQGGDTFHDSVTAGKSLVLCEVEIAGKTVSYVGAKVAASRLRVVREIRAIELNTQR